MVQLPCRGVKNSLNVGVAVGMCGYEIARQWADGGLPDVGEGPRPAAMPTARTSECVAVVTNPTMPGGPSDTNSDLVRVDIVRLPHQAR